MYQMRETVQYNPGDLEIASHIDKRILPYKSRMSEALTSNRRDTINQLGQIEDMLARTTQRLPSRLMICVQAIDSSMQIPIEDMAFQHYERNNFSDFAFWSDIAWGISMVRVPLYLGEEYIRENGEEAIQLARHEQEGYIGREITPSEAAEDYVVMQAEAREAANLLISDRSGFTLCIAAVELIKQPQQSRRIERIYPSNRIPSFVIAGAELCQLAYETMYPLTQRPSS